MVVSVLLETKHVDFELTVGPRGIYSLEESVNFPLSQNLDCHSLTVTIQRAIICNGSPE